jgi:hypothetical protein
VSIEFINTPDSSEPRKENTYADFTCTADANPPVNIGLYIGSILLYNDTGIVVTTRQKLDKQYNGLGFRCKTSNVESDSIHYNILCK